jgi:glycine/D-amino acid oxidase-like deaminating enzyme
MLGVTLAPATGEAIADMLESGGVPPGLEPFRPQRRI